MRYAIVITEIDYYEEEPYGEYNKKTTLYQFKDNVQFIDDLAGALQIAREQQRHRPNGFRYEVIEIGTSYII